MGFGGTSWAVTKRRIAQRWGGMAPWLVDEAPAAEVEVELEMMRIEDDVQRGKGGRE